MKDFYVYAFIVKGTITYIGKGRGDRMLSTNRKYNVPAKNRHLVIQDLTEQEAFAYERFLIALHGRECNGTGPLKNKGTGGEGASGFRPSEEQKKTRSLSMQGDKNPMWRGGPEFHKDPDNRNIMIRNEDGSLSHAESSKLLLSETHKGKTISRKTREKISKATKGKPKSAAHVAAMRAGWNDTDRYLLTHKDGRQEQVGNLRQFARDNGLQQPSLSKVLNGKLKSTGGWRVEKI